MENLRVLEGSEVFFRGLQHLYHQFKSGWRLLRSLRKYPEAFLRDKLLHRKLYKINENFIKSLEFL